MRWGKIEFRNFGIYRGWHSLDLARLPRVSAFRGPNGSGKSTLLGLPLGAVYRECPPRNGVKTALKDLSKSRDSELVVGWDFNGRGYVAKHQVDGIGGKANAVLEYADGSGIVPGCESGKVAEFDRVVSRLFPSMPIMLTSLFCSQKGSGFVEAKPTARKALLLELYAMTRFEFLAKFASEQESVSQRETELVAAELRSLLESSGGSVSELQERLALAEQAHQAAEANVTAAEAALQQAQRDALAFEERAKDRARLSEQRETLLAGQQRLITSAKDLEARVANNRMVLDKAEEIRAAARRVVDVNRQLDEIQKRGAALEAERRTLVESSRTDETELAQHDAGIKSAKDWISNTEKLLEDAAAVAEATSKLGAALLRVQTKKTAVEAAEATRERLSAERTAGDGERIDSLRSGLELITTEGLPDAAAVAVTTLEEDDAALARRQELPKQQADALETLRTARAELSSAEAEAARLEKLAGRADELQRAATALADAKAKLAAAEQQRRAKADQAQATRNRVMEIAAEQRKLVETTAALKPKEEILRLAELAPRIDQASELLVERTAALEAIQAERAEVDRQLEAVASALAQHADLPDATLQELAAREAVQSASKEFRATAEQVSDCRQRLKRAQDVSGRLLELERTLAENQADQADWARLTADLGKKGIQAAIVDGALPELNALANDYLHTCHGTRWTIEIRSQALSSSGKELLETLEIGVTDTVAGRDDPIETYSGGEYTILKEAISLALATIGSRNAGLIGGTLIRDEAGGALDPESGRAYVAMLRRAAELLDCKVIFVSHSPDTWTLADAQVVFERGQFELQ